MLLSVRIGHYSIACQWNREGKRKFGPQLSQVALGWKLVRILYKQHQHRYLTGARYAPPHGYLVTAR